MFAFASRYMRRCLLPLVMLAAPACPGLAAELTIGSKAAPLDIEHWVQRAGRGDDFKPLAEFDPGRVTVVEFRAAWCPPCRESMPQLAELQERFGDTRVTTVSVSDEDLETGEAEWIGHPMRIAGPLAVVVAGTVDREAAADDDEITQAQGRLREVVELVQAGDERAPAAFADAVTEAGDSAVALNELAWGVVQAIEGQAEISDDLASAAQRAAERSVVLEPENAAHLDTLAHLLAHRGDLDKALATQRLALEHAADSARGPIRGYLDELEARAALRSDEVLTVAPEDAAGHVGTVCSVTMPVASGRLMTDTGRCFLNSRSNHRDRGNFTVVIYASGLAKFAAAGVADPPAHFKGKTIRVTGRIDLHREQPQIKVTLPEQIEVMHEAESAAGPRR